MTKTEHSDIKENWLGKRRHIFMYGIPAAAMLVAVILYFTSGRYVSTDDAYIQAAKVAINSNISAKVVKILVKENQEVKTGDPLFLLDDSTFAIAATEAQAQYANARLQIMAMKANYQKTLANRKAAQATLDYQIKDHERQEKLEKAGINSKAQLDKSTQALQNARQQYAASQNVVSTELASLGGNPDADVENHPTVMGAKAAWDRAKLNLSYTIVTAPIDGIVTKVDQLQVGEYVTAATPVFLLISNKDIWVEANFKETDIAHMKIGQMANISVDAYDKKLTGRIVSLSPGTGSSFAVLPPENATGNWVKIVQRLPIKISIENSDNLALHPGLSVTAEVDTKSLPSTETGQRS